MAEDRLKSYADAILEQYTPHNAEVARYELKYNVYERKLRELHSSITEFAASMNAVKTEKVADDAVRKLKAAYRAYRNYSAT